MQPEEGYLWEVSQLMHAMIENTEPEIVLAMHYHLHTNLYSLMGEHGFRSKEELRNAIQYFRSGQDDPEKESRNSRANQFRERQIRSCKESSGRHVAQPGLTARLFSSLKDRLAGKANTPDKIQKEKEHDLSRE